MKFYIHIIIISNFAHISQLNFKICLAFANHLRTFPKRLIEHVFVMSFQ